MTNAVTTWGGKRRHSGRVRRIIHLTDDGALSLRLLQEALTLDYPASDWNADSLVNVLILQAVERLNDVESEVASQ